MSVRSFHNTFAKKKRAGPKKPKVEKTSGSPYAFSEADIEASRDKTLDLVLKALDAPKRVEPPISDEEKKRRHEIGRNYVVGKFKEHNAMMHDLACKIQLKKHAVKMLPKQSKLKEEALKIDAEGPPPWRSFAAWTPPIPGFNPDVFNDEDAGYEIKEPFEMNKS